jgi:hypothetical protein
MGNDLLQERLQRLDQELRDLSSVEKDDKEVRDPLGVNENVLILFLLCRLLQ